MIQTKMGPTEYGKVYNTVRTEVQERRRARKYKRSIQVRVHSSSLMALTKSEIDGCRSGEGREDEDQKA